MKIQPPVVALNESAVLSIEVRDAKNPQPPVLPDVPGLKISYTGQSSQMNWVNGKSDSLIAFNYRVYPQRTGTFTIGPVSYSVGKETKTLPATSLKVAGQNGNTQAQDWSDLVLARLSVDRHSAYVQEPFTLTLSICSRQDIQLGGGINLSGMPETGLSDLEWEELPASRDIINNAVFDVRRFRARVRTLGAGSFTFNPKATVQVVLPRSNSRRNRFTDDPFFNSFFSHVETRPVELSVEPATIEVKTLPVNGKPGNFSGAVGRFSFATAASPKEVHPGDPITLRMTVTGDGNFDRILPPKLPSDAPFRLFGEAVREQKEGVVQFEQVISPQNADVAQIPPIPFSFFDTASGQYTTVSSDPISISVTATSNDTAQVFAIRDSVVLPPQDTPFVTESELQKIESGLKRTWNVIRPKLWTVPALAGLVLLTVAGRKLQRHRNRDTARLRRQQAPKAARKSLRAAASALRRDNLTAYYDALWNAQADYFGHRLNLPPGDITTTQIISTLQKSGFAQVDDLKAIIEKLEAVRYGMPSESLKNSPEEMQRDLERILDQCEKTRF